MTQPDNDSIEASARAKLGEDRSIAERIKTADTVARLVYFLLGLVVVATLGIAHVWYRLSDTEKRLGAHDALFAERSNRIESLETYRNTNNLTLTAMQEIDRGLRKDLDADTDRLKKLEPDVQDMAFMRDHGISNKENFMQKHGYQAPSEEAEPVRPR